MESIEYDLYLLCFYSVGLPYDIKQLWSYSNQLVQ